MSEKNATPSEKKAALQANATKSTGQDAQAQRERLLETLSRFAVSTFETMRYLVYDPRPRVHELRHRLAYKITTVWETVVTESGQKYRVGLYVLESGGVTA